ncbi:MAG: DMT family transporter [Phycisphaerales bacterium]|nr:DMT family transporter [Phycisphaerales bacterium]
MRWILLVLIFLVGLLQPVQAGLNATVSKATGSRFEAGMTNGLVNVVLLVIVVLTMWAFFGKSSPGLSGLRTLPWWGYLGGAIGAGIVVVQLTAAPAFGAAVMVAVFVGGQCAGSILVDSTGLAGYTQRPIDTTRILGLVLAFAGMLLVAKPWASSTGAS